MLSGQVQTLNVAEGQVVNQGDTLFTIDTTTVTSTLSALQQSYNATKTATDQAISSAQIGVQNAELAVTQAQTSLDNTNALFEVGAASSQQVTQAEQALQQAQAALQQAQPACSRPRRRSSPPWPRFRRPLTRSRPRQHWARSLHGVRKVTEVNITLGGMAAQSTPAVVIARTVR